MRYFKTTVSKEIKSHNGEHPTRELLAKMDTKFRRRNVNHISRNEEKREDVGRGSQEKRSTKNQQVRMTNTMKRCNTFFSMYYYILLTEQTITWIRA